MRGVARVRVPGRHHHARTSIRAHADSPTEETPRRRRPCGAHDGAWSSMESSRSGPSRTRARQVPRPRVANLHPPLADHPLPGRDPGRREALRGRLGDGLPRQPRALRARVPPLLPRHRHRLPPQRWRSQALGRAVARGARAGEERLRGGARGQHRGGRRGDPQRLGRGRRKFRDDVDGVRRLRSEQTLNVVAWALMYPRRRSRTGSPVGAQASSRRPPRASLPSRGRRPNMRANMRAAAFPGLWRRRAGHRLRRLAVAAGQQSLATT